MKNTAFSYIFGEVIDGFKLDVEKIAVEIDRHPSRIRHWKKNEAPVKHLIGKVIQVLVVEIAIQNDSYNMCEFMKKTKYVTRRWRFFPEEIHDQIQETCDFESYLIFLLHRCYEYNHTIVVSENNVAYAENEKSINSDLLTAEVYMESGLLSDAIKVYENLSDNCHIKPGSMEHVEIHSNLGMIYQQLGISKVKEFYFNKSIQHFDLLISCTDPLINSVEYATYLKMNGSNYNALSRISNPIKNLELAKQSYKKALNYFNPITHKEDYSKVLNNIALTHINLSKYTNFKENLFKGFDILKKVNALQDDTFSPRFKALINMNYANILGLLVETFHGYHHLDSGKMRIYKALEFFTLENEPVFFAINHMNLGVYFIYYSILNNSVESLEEAIQQFHIAKWVYTKEDHPYQYIQILENLTYVSILQFEMTNCFSFLDSANEYLHATKSIADKQKNDQVSRSTKLLEPLYLYHLGVHKSDIDLLLLSRKMIKEVIKDNRSGAQTIKSYELHIKICNAIAKLKSELYFIEESLKSCNTLSEIMKVYEAPHFHAHLSLEYAECFTLMYLLTKQSKYKSSALNHLILSQSIYTQDKYPAFYQKIETATKQLG